MENSKGLTPEQQRTKDYLLKMIAQAENLRTKPVVADRLDIELYGLKFDWNFFTRDQRRKILRDIPLLKKTLKQFLDGERREAQAKAAAAEA